MITARAAPTLLSLLSLTLIQSTSGFSTGAPSLVEACEDLYPSGHEADPQVGESPYSIEIVEEEESYEPEDIFTVKISSTDQPFKGFLLQARSADPEDNGHQYTDTFGEFFLTDGNLQGYTQFTCGSFMDAEKSITHTSMLKNNALLELEIQFQAPSSHVGDLIFFATVVQEYGVFWQSLTSRVLKDPTFADDGSCDPDQRPVDKFPGDEMVSPNYPDLYPPNALCDWLINTTDELKSAGVVFHDFDLEFHTTCLYDYVYLYDGPSTSDPVFGKFCGSGIPPPEICIASGPLMLMRFRSDYIRESTGFHATAVAYDTGDYGMSPKYQFPLWGNFSSESGEDFTPECRTAYGTNMSNKVSLQISTLNAMIGTTACQGVNTEGMRVESSTTQFITEGNKGYTKFTYFLNTDNENTFDGVYTCADELSQYLQDRDNGGLPILPPEDGCPEVVFDEAFLDWRAHDVSDWDCSATKEEGRKNPVYTFEAVDDFEAVNEETLDPPCNDAYTLSWQSAVNGMKDEINTEISEGRLCTNTNGHVNVLSATSLFSASGSEGTIHAHFYLQVEDDTVSFHEVHRCASYLFEYVEDHSRWGQGPILPPESGCPVLDFGQERTFYKGDQYWQCV